jgi:hypothetical protein
MSANMSLLLEAIMAGAGSMSLDTRGEGGDSGGGSCGEGALFHVANSAQPQEWGTCPPGLCASVSLQVERLH